MTDTDAEEVASDWSPDGQWILFTRKEGPEWITQLWESHPDGSDEHLLAEIGFGVEADGAYSPDGTKIVFGCDAYPEIGAMCVLDRETLAVSPIDSAYAGPPSWQPRDER